MADDDDIVNTEKASRAVWLVKVPRYLSEVWEKNAGKIVGRLVVQSGETIFHNNFRTGSSTEAASATSTSKPNVDEQKLAGIKKRSNDALEIPSQHKFIIRDVHNQSLAVLSEDKSGLEEEADYRTGKLSIEGRVQHRAECQPPNSKDYMLMKVRQIQKVSQPKKTVQQMERAVVKFKPVNVHQEHNLKEKTKKESTRAVRLEKDEVVKLLFHAFEKHQYYRQADLQKITNQPANVVKEVLNDIGFYHDTAPHRSMWELKPEYRNYNKDLAKKVDNKMQEL